MGNLRRVLLCALVVAAVGGDPAHATFPGRNGEIGFIRTLGDSRSEIYAARPDGTHQRRLTYDGGVKSGPVYSPDGEWIAFTRRSSSGEDRIVVMDDHGHNRRRLTHGIDPQWRAGGRQIAFDRIGNPTRRYVMRPDGSHIRLLGRSFGSYSADDRMVVFRGGTGDDVGLFVMDTDGSERRQLTRSPVYPHNPIDDFPHWAYFDVEPRFSADGSRIVFVRQAGWDAFGYGDIYSIGTGGRHLRALTHPADRQTSSYTNPTFSPDGRFVLFAGRGGVYRARTDGTHRRVVVAGGWKVDAPDWQPLPDDG